MKSMPDQRWTRWTIFAPEVWSIDRDPFAVVGHNVAPIAGYESFEVVPAADLERLRALIRDFLDATVDYGPGAIDRRHRAVDALREAVLDA